MYNSDSLTVHEAVKDLKTVMWESRNPADLVITQPPL